MKIESFAFNIRFFFYMRTTVPCCTRTFFFFRGNEQFLRPKMLHKQCRATLRCSQMQTQPKRLRTIRLIYSAPENAISNSAEIFDSVMLRCCRFRSIATNAFIRFWQRYFSVCARTLLRLVDADLVIGTCNKNNLEIREEERRRNACKNVVGKGVARQGIGLRGRL